MEFVWLGYLLMFGVFEGFAISTKRPTLSATLWRWFRLQRANGVQVTPFVRLRRFVLLATLTWIVAHLLTGGYF